MIKSTVEQMADPIGFEIGMSDDVIQASLINGLSRAFKNSMQEHQMNNQICAVVQRLDETSMKVILEMAEFIKLRNK